MITHSPSQAQQIWTIQMSQWRLARDNDIQFMDITVKSGNQVFAPTWDNLRAYQDGRMTKEEYSSLYYNKVIASIKTHPQEWGQLLNHKKIALACYCRAGDFCHRHLFSVLAVSYIQSKRQKVEFMGELLPVSK
ncbi:MAG: DUF488 family protein, N3 subclade [Shewanella sp.]